jgi:hypothetical protein
VTFPEHPTIDEIADLQEDLLPAARAAEVRAHVHRCEQCRQSFGSLKAVTDILATEAAEPQRLPDSVAQRLDAALTAAAVERAAGVPTLAERRADASPEGRRRPHRWLLGLAAAAAAVVVLGAVLEIGGPDPSAEDAGSTAGGGQERSDASAGVGEFDTGAQSGGDGAAEQEPEPSVPAGRLTSQQLRVAARDFASGSLSVTEPTGRCAVVAERLDDDVLVSQYGSGSELGLMVIDEQRGTYRLVDCDTGALISKGTL